ncbi:MAG TPA: aldo/keto reductase [Tepidiformaceae bacterium]|nr:aldo/keto reductase [Tepidiformaceae bacterium]
MEYRNLGRSGLQVSVVGLGTNNFGRRCDLDTAKSVVNKCLDLGLNLFDTANVYGPGGTSEEYLGQALGARRQDVVIATKFAGQMGEGPMRSGGSRKHVMEACEASLRRLGTDYIDLYQVHFPDPTTPIEETMRALEDLVRQGKVRYIGHSNFSGWQTAEAHYVAQIHNLTPFISAQNQYSLLDRGVERELAPACQKYGLGVLPYFPLASGFLTGKYRRNEPLPDGARLSNPAMQGMASRVMTDRNWDILEKLEDFATGRGKTMTDLAVGWLASKPYVGSVIAGATKPEQVEANVQAGEWKLTADEMAEVDAIAR